jgi:adenylylsulfate kinase
VVDLAFIVWLTGLPGSGKTNIAIRLSRKLRRMDVHCYHLQMDKVRRLLIDRPEYTESERDYAYRSLAVMAYTLYQAGVSVIVDATAHRRRWREFLRRLVESFLEVYVKCPVEVCIKRETRRRSNLVRRRIYLDALHRIHPGRRRSVLGSVPGVDVPFEEGDRADILVVDSESNSSEVLAQQILHKLRAERYLPQSSAES